MAKKLDSDYDFLSPEEIQLLCMTEPVQPGIFSFDWLRRDPRFTTDRLADSTPPDGRDIRDYDERHL